jgi:hypothetical protein
LVEELNHVKDEGHQWDLGPKNVKSLVSKAGLKLRFARLFNHQTKRRHEKKTSVSLRDEKMGVANWARRKPHGARPQTLTTKTTSQLQVLGLDSDTLGVDGSQVGVLEQRDEVRLGRLLKSLFVERERWQDRFRKKQEK